MEFFILRLVEAGVALFRSGASAVNLNVSRGIAKSGVILRLLEVGKCVLNI